MRFAATIAFLLLPLATTAQVYKWKDASGRTHYSDQPPANVDIPSRKLGPEFSSAQADENARKTAADKRLDASKKAADTKESAAKTEKQLAEDLQRQQDCERARANLQGIEAGQIRFRINAAGEREGLDGDARESELANARRSIEASCSPRPTAPSK
jgi:hypothetical protein